MRTYPDRVCTTQTNEVTTTSCNTAMRRYKDKDSQDTALLLQQHLLLEKRANRQSCTNCRLCSSRTPCLKATSKIHDTRNCCTRRQLLFFMTLILNTHNGRLPFRRSGLKRQSSHTSCFRHASRLSPTCSSSSHCNRNRDALLQQHYYLQIKARFLMSGLDQVSRNLV